MNSDPFIPTATKLTEELIGNPNRTDRRKIWKSASKKNRTKGTDMTRHIDNRIASLKQEASQHGDYEMVRMINRTVGMRLFDSNTAEVVSDYDLDCSLAAYVEAMVDSLDCVQVEGHVLVNGRKVYAQ